MYLMYIDESGDTASLQQAGSNVLVLAGCIIDENDKRNIEEQFREIKRKYYQNPDVEIKSNFLRYANPNITDPNKFSPIKMYDQGQYDALQMAGYEGDAHRVINEQAMPLIQGGGVSLLEAVEELAELDSDLAAALEHIPSELRSLFLTPEHYIGKALEKAREIADLVRMAF